MAQKISVSYDWGNLPISVGEGTESNHVLNKSQVDSAIAGSETVVKDYTDTKDTATRDYIDSKILGLGEFVGALDPNSGLPTTGTGDGGAIDKNDYWTFANDGVILGEEVHKYEKLIANVDGASIDNEFRIEHAPKTADSRYQFDNLVVPATVQEARGQFTAEVQTPLENGDVWNLGSLVITAGGNLDVVSYTTVEAQATAVKAILEADNAFNAQYAISDDLAGTLTIVEKQGQATGIDLTHNEAGVVGGNAVFNTLVNSIAYDLGDVIVAHNLGYKYVQIISAESTTDMKLETPPVFIDTNSLKLINESDTAITVNGVVSI